MALVWVESFTGKCDQSANNVAPSPTGVMDDWYLFSHDDNQFRFRTDTPVPMSDTHGVMVSNGVYNTIIKTHDIITDGTAIVGLGVQLYDVDEFVPDFRWPILSFEDTSNQVCVNLMIQVDGSCYLQDASGDQIVGGLRLMQRSSGWNYLEMKSDSGNSANAAVRFNGATIWEGTLNTAGRTISRVGIGRNVQSYGFKFGRVDNWYICDGSGSDNNDFLGIIDIEPLWPNGDDTTDWSITGNGNYATHYEQLIRGQRDGSTDYVEESSSNQYELFTVENLSSNLDTIYGVAVCSMVSYVTTNAGFQNVLSSNGTTVNGPSLPITTAMELWANNDGMYCVETDPDTGNVWTNAGINAMKTGFRTAP